MNSRQNEDERPRGLSSCGSSQQAVSPVPASIPDADPYWDYDEGDCHNCGGEGFVYGCSWDWQCDTWDGESCLCTRPCEWCHPPKPNPELSAILARAIDAAQVDGNPKGGDAEQAPGDSLTARSATPMRPNHTTGVTQ